MTGDTFAVGDRVFYVLRKSLRDGRPEDLYLSGTVRKITEKNIVIDIDWNHAHRNAGTGRNLVRTAPVGAWVKP